ncbi:DUF4148 domain-containing protein [Eleftheria terrae]|uniref:DUF4148 domain-containing protein n=1 Tax=Eleftheria terrae TaxID=1597781 RepID=UPI00263A7103|nr:DUF4148 domain-containing protein [Eleftheria terrae]WKB51846.1 DUF4148 domain-containing protein [Eleftheria terrae]
MNAKTTLIAAVMTAFAATGAFAQQAAAPAGKTRAEVQAEVARARAAGEDLPVFSGEASVFSDSNHSALARRAAEDARRQAASKQAPAVGK